MHLISALPNTDQDIGKRNYKSNWNNKENDCTEIVDCVTYSSSPADRTSEIYHSLSAQPINNDCCPTMITPNTKSLNQFDDHASLPTAENLNEVASMVSPPKNDHKYGEKDGGAQFDNGQSIGLENDHGKINEAQSKAHENNNNDNAAPDSELAINNFEQNNNSHESPKQAPNPSPMQEPNDNSASNQETIFVPFYNQEITGTPVAGALRRGRRESSQIISDLLERDNRNALDHFSQEVDLNNNNTNGSLHHYGSKNGINYDHQQQVYGHPTNEDHQHHRVPCYNQEIAKVSANSSLCCQQQNEWYRQNHHHDPSIYAAQNNNNIVNHPHNQIQQQQHQDQRSTSYPEANFHDASSGQYLKQAPFNNKLWDTPSNNNKPDQRDGRQNDADDGYCNGSNDGRYASAPRYPSSYSASLQDTRPKYNGYYHQANVDLDNNNHDHHNHHDYHHHHHNHAIVEQHHERDLHTPTSNNSNQQQYASTSEYGFQASSYMVQAQATTTYPLYDSTAAETPGPPSCQHVSYTHPHGPFHSYYPQSEHQNGLIGRVNSGNNNNNGNKQHSDSIYETVAMDFHEQEREQEKIYHILGEDQQQTGNNNNDQQLQRQAPSNNREVDLTNGNCGNLENNLDEMLLNYAMTSTCGDACPTDINGLPILSKEYDPTEELNLLDYEPNEDEVNMNESTSNDANEQQRQQQQQYHNDDGEQDDEDDEDEEDADSYYGEGSRSSTTTNTNSRASSRLQTKVKSNRIGSRFRSAQGRSGHGEGGGMASAPRCSEKTIEALKRMLELRRKHGSVCVNSNGTSSLHRHSTSSTTSTTSSLSSSSSSASPSTSSSTPSSSRNHNPQNHQLSRPTTTSALAIRNNNNNISNSNSNNHSNRRSGVVNERKQTHTNRPMTRHWIKANGLLSSNA